MTEPTTTVVGPLYTVTVTAVPFLTFFPAAGIWPAIVPASLLEPATENWIGEIRRPAALSSFCATAIRVPFSCGTTVGLGSSLIASTASAATTGTTTASHHGSQDRCR